MNDCRVAASAEPVETASFIEENSVAKNTEPTQNVENPAVMDTILLFLERKQVMIQRIPEKRLE